MASFFSEIWKDYRPFLKAIVVDLLISISLWAAVYLFKAVTDLLPMEGRPAALMKNIHSSGVTIAFAFFVTLFLLDIYRIRKERGD